ncbi:2-succinyl-6-hydroxy-2,4-cyclohexadiene-1-carboxylate synthase [Sulfobacillus acidophilus TPY]|uniref:2-succinyl-5-enolpyruvyl-6-hydroxy-3-cyclohexene-1-carboxylate synthase n=1 Tax=Sulfobacillus acidophilus (strain ATCC 700253 / DSM 10332 / NAL) TaxID=679936 RepID=G8TVU5_SULAD|nr:2-succinyl-6-hydroxy-2,4-cyclohexadiene-1-carboxylate synthase [Sulfobacillus acidophilus TPY]AEW04789.1 2-succinyl-6-hydroxy-2,4-cyclohexadiene-1-carboxylate synthase [Sulfobacillus acidophilus DSM 10332]
MNNPGTRAPLGQFIATLAQAGVEQVVIAPGSRSTPLAVLFYESAVKPWVLFDERSAGFFALGLAKATQKPVAIVCTSGTAAANLLPAVVEARLSRVPLIVLTADRPRELRDVGAAQTIDQVRLYGSHAKWFQDLPSPGGPVEVTGYYAQVAARAAAIATAAPRGPVHINFPLREPLLPWGDASDRPFDYVHVTQAQAPMPDQEGWIEEAPGWLAPPRHGIVILGPESPVLSEAVLRRLLQRGWPVLADPLAPARRTPGTITRYDAFLRVVKDHIAKPDVVIQLGSPPTSKVLNQWLQHVPWVLLDDALEFRQPDPHPVWAITGDPSATVRALTDRWPRQDPEWTALWQTWEDRTAQALPAIFGELPERFEARLFHALPEWLTAQDFRHPLFIANSMPIRDLDSFSGPLPVSVYGNRGANGIDGLISTALGVSAAQGDVIAVVGDLAFYHDMNGLLAAAQHHLNALIIVINNQGGGIFSFLSQKDLPEAVFEPLFGTPHQLDFSGAATIYGGRYRRVDTLGGLKKAWDEWLFAPGLRVIEWRTLPRPANVQWHEIVWSRLKEVLPDARDR